MNDLRTIDGLNYQIEAMRTNDNKGYGRLVSKMASDTSGIADLINGALGLAGETGEFLDMVKKWIFHEQVWDEEHAQKELGDICWYIALICHSRGWNLSDIMRLNIEKLRSRYPSGFDVEHSNHRREGDI